MSHARIASLLFFLSRSVKCQRRGGRQTVPAMALLLLLCAMTGFFFTSAHAAHYANEGGGRNAVLAVNFKY